MKAIRIGIRVAACVALLSASAAPAAELCAGPCSVAMDFASGGTITSNSGATITFGPGGSLSLGSAGSMVLGEGGSVTPTPAAGQPPDFSTGGSIVLGPGGEIVFGEGGALATGEAGGVSVPGDGGLDVQSARSVTIDSPHTVRFGNLASEGAVNLTGTRIYNLEAGTPINFSTLEGDEDTQVTVSSGGDLSWNELQWSPDFVTLVAGDIDLWTDGTFGPAAPGSGATGSITLVSGATIDLLLNGGFTVLNDTITLVTVPSADPPASGPLEVPGGAAGSMGGFALLLLAGATGLRRRLVR